MGAINVDDALVSSSNWVNCAVGASYVDLTGAGAGLSRWGDYTGICRKRNTSPARVWGCGSFGNASHTYTAKIFQMGITNFTGGSGERSNTDQDVVNGYRSKRLTIPQSGDAGDRTVEYSKNRWRVAWK